MAPLDVIVHAAGSVSFRCNCETPDRVKPERITAPMALRPDHSDAMAALRETYDFCIRCFRQYGLENVRK